ncbi:hypothetical protein [Acaryochloris thomasi]|nr:hypothetical protein [Acaryochloris thomasi]
MAHHGYYKINVTTGDKLHALQQSCTNTMVFDRLSAIVKEGYKRMTLADV